MIFALAGNPNCGKTTLFNQLTGSNQQVGNFPGVTVERKAGSVRDHAGLQVVDLPGIYALSPYTPEEMVARDFVIKEKPEGIVNIVDATNIERSLYLTLQLLELDIPLVLALNMMDEVQENGGSIEVQRLSEALGIPVVPISALKNRGTAQLVAEMEQAAKQKRRPRPREFYSGPVHQAVCALAQLVEAHARQAAMPVRFAAAKLAEGDAPTIQALRLGAKARHSAERILQQMETARGLDREAAMADMRYAAIQGMVQKTVKRPQVSKAQLRTRRADRLLLGKYTAFPAFFCIMAAVFYGTFGPVGSFFADRMGNAIDGLAGLAAQAMTYAQVNPILHSLVMDGIFGGVGTVLRFLPTILLLFFLLSVLEDSGYMARIALIMDKPLRRLGLSGRSFVPMLLGFGCSVPGILATRTLAGARDRRMTAILVPFMSCNAKLPIYAAFAQAFFPAQQAQVMIGLYALGILLAVLAAWALKKTVFCGEAAPFVMELPAYRMPSAKSVCLHMWERAKEFVLRAFSLILLASVAVWLLQTFDVRLRPVQEAADSMLARIGSFLRPLFAPLGFGSWQAVAALLTGLTAKETVVSTLAILTGAGSEAALTGALHSLFTPPAAMAYLVFCLLYTPCMAAVSAQRQALGSRSAAFWVVVFQLGVAWSMAYITYTLGG